MLDEGCVALMPVDASENPNETGAYEIKSWRVAKILDWYPHSVRLEYYSEVTGHKEYRHMQKSAVAIIENPLYAVVNEAGSILKRLIHKLNQFDVLDDKIVGGKLDVIIQLPYVIKTNQRAEQAEIRRKMLEEQLTGSQLGVGYIDGTERVIQLNRPVENHFLEQIDYWTNMFYDQLGLSKAVVDGTADEHTMLNYYARTRDPILTTITEALEKKFLSKTARTQGQRIMYFTDPFKLLTATNLANIADKFTRNEILSSNEVRGLIGFRPVDSERANELVNKNIAIKNEVPPSQTPNTSQEGERQNGSVQLQRVRN
jgi:hypothetical protein